MNDNYCCCLLNAFAPDATSRRHHHHFRQAKRFTKLVRSNERCRTVARLVCHSPSGVQRVTFAEQPALLRISTSVPLEPGEEIELKCYSLSPDRLLVNSDRRCRLVNRTNAFAYARPLSNLDEGRRHLDVRPPASMSLIRFRLDPASGQLERRLSIHEIQSGAAAAAADEENDGHLSERQDEVSSSEHTSGEAAPSEEELQHRYEQVATELQSRAYLLVERQPPDCDTRPPDLGEQHQVDEDAAAVCDIAQATTMGESQLSQSLEEFESSASTPPPPLPSERRLTSDSLEHQLLSSISIEPPPELRNSPGRPVKDEASARLAEGERQTKKQKWRVKRLRVNIVRRFHKFLGSPAQKQPEIDDNSPLTPPSGAFENLNYETNRQFDGRPARVATNRAAASPTELANQLVPLTRPESTYLWPERLNPEFPLTSSRPHTGVASPQVAMISYNHAEGQEYAVALHSHLEQLGVSAYLDLYDIGKGEDWQDSLNYAILECAVFIPLVTPSYGETLWTSRECKLADVLAKRIIPINFGQRWPPPSLAIQFATLQYIDWLHLDTELTGAFEQRPNVAAEFVYEPASLQRGNGPTLIERPRWPSECAQSVALQLRRSIASQFGHLLQLTANGRSNSTAPRLAKALRPPPPPHSDSGYDEFHPISPSKAQSRSNSNSPTYTSSGKVTASQLPVELNNKTDAILNVSLKSSARGNSLKKVIRGLRARAREKSSQGKLATGYPLADSYGSTDCAHQAAAAAADSYRQLPIERRA